MAIEPGIFAFGCSVGLILSSIDCEISTPSQSALSMTSGLMIGCVFGVGIYSFFKKTPTYW